jgi:AcrR family transcriptional regulator
MRTDESELVAFAMIEIPKLKVRERTGIYAPGKARITQILSSALDILIKEGHAAVTLREIARRCGVRVGAVSYYYSSRSALIRDLLDSAVAPYYEIFGSLVHDKSYSAEERLERLIRLNIRDLRTEKTSKFFPELWVMANRDRFASRLVETIYKRQRDTFEQVIAELNPRLGKRELKLLALFVSSAQEGLTMFVGYKKRWSGSLPEIENIAVKGLLDLVKSITNEDVRRTVPSLENQPKTNTRVIRNRSAGARAKGDLAAGRTGDLERRDIPRRS